MNIKIKKDTGSALALVLIFVTMLGGWLGVTLLLTQASTSGIQRLNLQSTDASQVAIATATVLEQLTVNPTFGSSAYTPSTQPNCGLPATINSISVTCTPVTGGSQPLASAAVQTTTSSGTSTGVDNGIAVTGSHSFNSSLQSFSSNITVASGTVTAPQLLTPSGGAITGVTASTGTVPGTAANLPTSSVTPVISVSDPGTGIGGSINSLMPSNCYALNSTITIPSGNYNDEAIDQLNQLFTNEIIRTYKSNGSTTDRDCTESSSWNHKVDIAFGRGAIYFKGNTVLHILKNPDDSSERIAIHNDSSDAVVTYDSKGSPTGCSYSHGFTAISPSSSSDVSGSQIIFGGAATLENEDGDFKLCGPHQAIGQSFAVISLDASHQNVCAAKKGASSKCPAVHTGSTPLLYAHNDSSAKTFVYGTVLASGSSVRIDESTSKQHEIDGGIVSDGAKFSCSLSVGACAFPVQAGPAVTGRHLKITLRTTSGTIFEHEIICDDNSGLNPASHFSITSTGS